MSETRPGTIPHSPPSHETRDADIRKLTWMGIALVGLVIFGFIVTEGAFRYLVGQRPIKPPTALFTRSQMPPPPLLQEHPGVELSTYLQEQNHLLDSYGWVDRKAGIVRIPVARAMDLLLQKGLPVRPPGQVTRAVSAPHELPRGDFGPAPEPVPGPRMQ